MDHANSNAFAGTVATVPSMVHSNGTTVIKRLNVLQIEIRTNKSPR